MMIMMKTIKQSIPRCFDSFSMSSTLSNVVFSRHIVDRHHDDDDGDDNNDGGGDNNNDSVPNNDDDDNKNHPVVQPNMFFVASP